ncbi:uncharacterized protein LOC127849088 isoform X2 [Dreissena polymorpha]|uniref:uncharacterized protein LOC127849088 isoform X1 n=1 Tax=Dreissena polymorpha TaxID=45954 RepID=UPI002264C795|nr:uncharacterized protein LOC127849088 isoform X1 [Dreissena polymorpha]XP_052237780.1 uncharacterized protein LOC127849088 isoform X2 [Dreissena polymorpha]
MDAVTLNEKKREKRKLNWTKMETEVLAAAYIEQHALINGNFSSTLSGKDKDLAWEKIAEQINALGAEERTVEEIRKKISDTKTKLRKKERQRRLSMKQTGGGPAITLEKWEEKMIEVIGEESIVGFGGVDTFAVQRTQQPMIAEQHGQSCSTMCVEPTVALEPQVVGGVATPNQKTKMSPSTKNKRRKTSEDDDHEDVLQLLRQQNETLDAILLEQRRTRELLAKLFSFPLNEQ